MKRKVSDGEQDEPHADRAKSLRAPAGGFDLNEASEAGAAFDLNATDEPVSDHSKSKPGAEDTPFGFFDLNASPPSFDLNADLDAEVEDEGDRKLPVSESEGGGSDADPAPKAGTPEAEQQSRADCGSGGRPSGGPQGAGEEEKGEMDSKEEGETQKEAEVEEGGGGEAAVGGERVKEGERADIPDFIRQLLQDVSSLPPAPLSPPPPPPQPEKSEADTEALTTMKL